MNKKIYLMVLFLFLFFAFLAGYTLPESSASGEYVGAVTGKQIALGGAAIMGEEWINPALLVKQPGFKLVIGGGFIKAGERRKKSIFDSFDNRIGDVTAADNSFVFSEPTYISVSYSTHYNVAIGINFLPFINFGYRYSREVRDNFYVLKETIFDEGKGKVYLTNIGIAYKLLKERLLLGFGFNLYNGKREWEYSEDYVDPSQADVNERFTRTLSGNSAVFGILARPLTRIKLGGFISTKSSLGYYNEDNIPLRFGGGITIIPPNRLPALFIIDAVFERWARINDNYEDVIKLHLGVEHEFTPVFKGRFGFGYETSYLSKDMPKIFFTSGFGFEKNGFILDTALEVCGFNYTGGELPIEQQDMEGITRVEESLVKLIFSISYRR